MWIRYLLFACVPPGVAGVYVRYWFDGWPWLLSFIVKNMMAFGRVGADVNGQRCPVRCHGAFFFNASSPRAADSIVTLLNRVRRVRQCPHIGGHSNYEKTPLSRIFNLT